MMKKAIIVVSVLAMMTVMYIMPASAGWKDAVIGQLQGLQASPEPPLPPSPEPIQPEHKFIAAGQSHSLALTCDGDVYAWGDNGCGECGMSWIDAAMLTFPLLLEELQELRPDTGAVEVVGGGQYSMSLMSDGTVYAWGNNREGQLGNGSDLDEYQIPYQVHGPVGGDELYLTEIKKVEAGADFSLALRDDGTLWAWGEGGRGQLGLHSDNDHTVPYQVQGPGNVGFLTDGVGVAAGDRHSLALKSDGTVWSWGYGGHGQLGIHTKDDHTVPYQVHGPDNVGYLTGIGPICTP